MKCCPRCGSEKPVGYQNSWCRPCKADHERKRRKDNPDSWRNAHYKYYYGITVDDYNVMLENQQGVCAICGKIDSHGIRLAVDHNHQTKEVRGLLCAYCNGRLGWFDKHQEKILSYSI